MITVNVGKDDLTSGIFCTYYMVLASDMMRHLHDKSNMVLEGGVQEYRLKVNPLR